MSRLTFERVVKEYGSVTALQSLDLEIQEGEFLTLLGPSGCGKTTTLRLIAGFILPTQGTIYLEDEDITHLAPQKRRIGMVFQDYALFPHMTVRDNLAFGLVERGFDKRAIRSRVGELLELVKLEGVDERFPAELSGGQQQRIAVARAVAYTPRVLLMDEPLGALDLKLREAMQVELRRIQQELKITTVYVTHDQTEAMSMSDQIAVMNNGVLEQIGTARAIYDAPKTKFVADFIGQINFLSGRVIGREDGWRVVETSNTKVRVPGEAAPETGEVTVAIRPEALAVLAAPATADGRNTLAGRIVGKTFAGNLTKLAVDVGAEAPVVVEGHAGDPFGEAGEAVTLAWAPKDTLVLTR